MLMKITYFHLPDSKMVNTPEGEVSVGPLSLSAAELMGHSFVQ